MSASTDTPVKDNPTIADLRESRSLTQDKAAELIGISQARLSQIESEGVEKVGVLEAMADAYGYDLGIIIAAIRRTKNK
jgi:transcriptional regulator with XRE-family HTH domain